MAYLNIKETQFICTQDSALYVRVFCLSLFVDHSPTDRMDMENKERAFVWRFESTRALDVNTSMLSF